MEDLDVKIETMCREKLFTLIQDNSRRFQVINIRCTKNNQKNSKEHLDELYVSYDKLLRAIPKDLLKMEQTIRLKFLVTMNADRKIRVLSSLHEEIGLIIQQMVKRFRVLYKVIGCLDDFDTRIEQTRLKCKENIESRMDSLLQVLKKDVETANTISPDQLTDKYGIDGETLNQMHLVKVLQDINTVFGILKDSNTDETVLNGVDEGIIERVKYGKRVENQIPPSHDVKGRKTWRMRVAKESVKLKEMIYALHTLGDYAQKPEDERNYDVIQKTWGRIEDTFGEIPDDESEIILLKIKPFYKLLDN